MSKKKTTNYSNPLDKVQIAREYLEHVPPLLFCASRCSQFSLCYFWVGSHWTLFTYMNTNTHTHTLYHTLFIVRELRMHCHNKPHTNSTHTRREAQSTLHFHCLLSICLLRQMQMVYTQPLCQVATPTKPQNTRETQPTGKQNSHSSSTPL